jgi:hypothetical protein
MTTPGRLTGHRARTGALAVGLGLWLAYRGRSVLVASGVGLATYVVLAAGFAALP